MIGFYMGYKILALYLWKVKNKEYYSLFLLLNLTK